MDPYYADEQVTLHLGDSLNVLPTLPDASVDAVVCDPPYELSFMGRAWDASGIAYNPVVWTECLRILKPGGHLLAFGGTRTYHRMAVAIEDAGAEIRDSIHWIYGSGMPKSLDVSKAIDKAAGAERKVVGTATGRAARPRNDIRGGAYGSTPSGLIDTSAITAPATPDVERWSGWGSALKPSHEPIVLARKPLSGTVAANVLEHGTGALNIEGCRVGSGGQLRWERPRDMGYHGGTDAGPVAALESAVGRWPTNIALSHPPLIDEHGQPVGDACADGCIPGCPVADMDAQSGATASPRPYERSTSADSAIYGTGAGTKGAGYLTTGYGDSGGASRFFPVFRYEAKAPATERPRLPDGTAWPTVKPLALMQWLVRLVTPPSGVVLDPFAGTGTTLEAAALEDKHAIGIERDPAAAELSRIRLTKPRAIGFDFGGAA